MIRAGVIKAAACFVLFEGVFWYAGVGVFEMSRFWVVNGVPPSAYPFLSSLVFSLFAVLCFAGFIHYTVLEVRHA